MKKLEKTCGWNGSWGAFRARYEQSHQEIAADIVNQLRENHRICMTAREKNALPETLLKIGKLLEHASLPDDIWIAFEYVIPRTNQCRVDCVLFGRSESKSRAVVLEAKLWSGCTYDQTAGYVIATHRPNEHLYHPLLQALDYKRFISSLFQVARGEQPDLEILAFAYLPNIEHDGRVALKTSLDEIEPWRPEAGEDLDSEALAKRLGIFLKDGKGSEAARLLGDSPLLDIDFRDAITEAVSVGSAPFALLGGQQDAFYKLAKAIDTKKGGKFLIQGGPGSGKTAIAMNLVHQLHAQSPLIDVRVALGSKGYRKVANSLVSIKRDGRDYFLHCRAASTEDCDVLIVDEAHRIPGGADEARLLLRRAPTVVFLGDSGQIILPQERAGWETIEATSDSISLDTQFRSNADYVDFVNITLQPDRDLSGNSTASRRDFSETFEFEIFGNADELKTRMNDVAKRGGDPCRLVAGYAWPWINEEQDFGGLRSRWAPNPKRLEAGTAENEREAAEIWSIAEIGHDYVGSVYHAQNCDFDYVAVIVGPDLSIRGDRWVAGPRSWQNIRYNGVLPHQDLQYVLNAYRVLLTRARRACFLFVPDPAVRAAFQNSLGRYQ